MSKKNNRQVKEQRAREHQKMLTENAEIFATGTLKKYKKKAKKEGYGFDNKKELRNSYYGTLMEYLCPDTIEWLLRYGYRNDAETTKIREGVYEQLRDEKFVKWMTKTVKKFQGKKKKKKRSVSVYGFENLEFLPIFLRDIILDLEKKNQIALAANPNAKIASNKAYVGLSYAILSHSIKDMVDAGVPEELAFNVLSVIPSKDVMAYSVRYRLATLFTTLYDASKGIAVPFATIIENLFDHDENAEFAVILFALLERKEKFGSLTDNQKKLYLSINNWVFDTLEKKDKEFITTLLEDYVKSRKRDDAQGKDSNRRYALSSLSENEYKNITSVMKSMILQDESVKKYF